MMVIHAVVTTLLLWAITVSSKNSFFVKAQVVNRTAGTYGRCYYPECIEAECCASGSTWDSTSGLCIAGFPSFNGTYPDDFTHECRKHSCYDQQCCGQGTDYIGGVCMGTPLFGEVVLGLNFKGGACGEVPPMDEVETLVDDFLDVYSRLALPFCFSIGSPSSIMVTAPSCDESLDNNTDNDGGAPPPSNGTDLMDDNDAGDGGSPPFFADEPAPGNGATLSFRVPPFLWSCRKCICKEGCLAGLPDRRMLQESSNENDIFPNLLPDGTCAQSGVPDLNQVLTNFNQVILQADDLPADKEYTANFVDINSLGSISGTVFEDVDNDDAGDVALTNTLVSLIEDGGAVLATTFTNADGKYIFEFVPSGNYSVVETDPVNYVSVSDIDGDDNNVIALEVQTPNAFDPFDFTAISEGNDFVDEAADI